VTFDGDRLSCSRCGRNITRSHATSVRQFWEIRCYANLGGVHLRAVARSVALWNKVKAERHCRATCRRARPPSAMGGREIQFYQMHKM
jgi:hypothetical protein